MRQFDSYVECASTYLRLSTILLGYEISIMKFWKITEYRFGVRSELLENLIWSYRICLNVISSLRCVFNVHSMRQVELLAPIGRLWLLTNRYVHRCHCSRSSLMSLKPKYMTLERLNGMRQVWSSSIPWPEGALRLYYFYNLFCFYDLSVTITFQVFDFLLSVFF